MVKLEGRETSKDGNQKQTDKLLESICCCGNGGHEETVSVSWQVCLPNQVVMSGRAGLVPGNSSRPLSSFTNTADYFPKPFKQLQGILQACCTESLKYRRELGQSLRNNGPRTLPGCLSAHRWAVHWHSNAVK